MTGQFGSVDAKNKKKEQKEKKEKEKKKKKGKGVRWNLRTNDITNL